MDPACGRAIQPSSTTRVRCQEATFVVVDEVSVSMYMANAWCGCRRRLQRTFTLSMNDGMSLALAKCRWKRNSRAHMRSFAQTAGEMRVSVVDCHIE